MLETVYGVIVNTGPCVIENRSHLSNAELLTALEFVQPKAITALTVQPYLCLDHFDRLLSGGGLDGAIDIDTMECVIALPQASWCPIWSALHHPEMRIENPLEGFVLVLAHEDFHGLCALNGWLQDEWNANAYAVRALESWRALTLDK